jgi:hypothetical protein
MNIRKKMIDDVTNSDWTREKLAEQLLESRYHCNKNKLQAVWLDQLATHYRDNQNDDDYGQVCTDLYTEYKEDLKTLKHLYYEQRTP